MPHPTDPTLALVELTQRRWAVIDAADAIAVGKFNWAARQYDDGSWYAIRSGKICKNEPGSLHRLIASLHGFDMSHDIDHKDGNGLDCRQFNLRPATKAQNQWNRFSLKRNKTGVKGVHLESQTGRYRAEIWVNKKHLRLGRFDTLAEAKAVIIASRQAVHGEFANNGKTS
jgi:hypothetical protein